MASGDGSSEDRRGDAGASASPIAVAVPISQHHNDRNILTLANASLSDIRTDEEARALAASSREEGVADIRRHCRRHMSQNPESSYVTWIATLHPENARVFVDRRFFIAGNPWLTVYEEAREDLQKGGSRPVSSSEDDPNATAPTLDGRHINESAKTKRCSGFLDFVIGNLLVVAGALAAIVIEIISAYAYLSFWICHKIERSCYPPGLLSWLPLLIAFVIGRSFQLIDLILLFTSTFIVEAIAAANFATCTFLGCSLEVGLRMHQMTRKTPHIVRWAFRRPFENWDPKRSYCARRAGGDEEDVE